MLPFTASKEDFDAIETGDFVFVPGIREALSGGSESVAAVLVKGGRRIGMRLSLGGLSNEDRDIILAGCLMNHYAGKPR